MLQTLFKLQKIIGKKIQSIFQLKDNNKDEKRFNNLFLSEHLDYIRFLISNKYDSNIMEFVDCTVRPLTTLQIGNFIIVQEDNWFTNSNCFGTLFSYSIKTKKQFGFDYIKHCIASVSSKGYYRLLDNDLFEQLGIEDYEELDETIFNLIQDKAIVIDKQNINNTANNFKETLEKYLGKFPEGSHIEFITQCYSI